MEEPKRNAGPAQADNEIKLLARVTASIQAGASEEHAALRAGITSAQLQTLRQERLGEMAALASRGRLSQSLRFSAEVAAEQNQLKTLAKEARRNVLPSSVTAEPSPENAVPLPQGQVHPNIIELEPQSAPPETQAPPETAAPAEIPEPAAVRGPALPFTQAAAPPKNVLHQETGANTIAMPSIPELSTPLPFIETTPSTLRTPEINQKTVDLSGKQLNENAATPWAKPIRSAETPAPADVLPFRKSTPPPMSIPASIPVSIPVERPAPQAETLLPADLERIQKITLAQYAHICATTRAHRGDISEVLHQFAMSPTMWRALHSLWRERFTSDPVLKQRCEILIEKRTQSLGKPKQ